VGEFFYIPVVLLVGGLIARYAKTHPFYKYKTQKLKDKYFSHLYPSLAASYESTEAYWLTRAVTDFVFDFDRRLYRDQMIERYKGHVEAEKDNLYKYHVEPPNKLCEELVMRAVELKVPAPLFLFHMRELWQKDIVPVGKLTPASIKNMAGAEKYYQELMSIPTSKDAIYRFMKTHSSEQSSL